MFLIITYSSFHLTQVHFWKAGRIGRYVVTSPMVLGHESSGVVAEVGAKVTHLRPGDRVAIEPGRACRRCEHCRGGAYHLCPDMVFAALPPTDGTLSKYFVSPADLCYRVPDAVSLEEAAMVEPVAVAVTLCRTAGLRAHQSVVVLGCGPIGILCAAVARAWGAKVVVGVDVVQSRLDLATRYGADGVFLPEARGAAAGMQHSQAMADEVCRRFELLRGGADVVLECSGAEACVQMGVFVAKPGGTMVQAGLGREEVRFPITHVCTQGISVKGSIRYLAGAYPAAIDLIAGGKVDAKGLITNRFRFEEAEGAFELVREGRPDVFKVMIAGVQE